MITLNQTAGNNNETIWVLKINTDTPIYIATKDIELDSTFDGQVLNRDNYLSDISQSSSIVESGGIGSVSSFNFSISRYNVNTSLDGFMNEFYPATSGVYLTSVFVQLGICWVGATADTDITWLMAGRIIDYSYEQRKLNLTVFQESEITNKELPYYSIQKDFDNGVSYYTNAPDDCIGKEMPIVYGDFDNTAVSIWGKAKVTPALLVDSSSLIVIGASHKAFFSGYHVFLYEEGVSSYVYLTSANNSGENEYTRHSMTLQTSPTQIYGEMYIKLSQATLSGDVMQIDNLIDDDLTNYVEIDAGEYLGVKMAGSPSDIIGTPGLGVGGTSATGDIEISFYLSSDSAGNRLAYVGMINPSLNSTTYSDYAPGIISTGTTPILRRFNISGTTENKREANLPWRLSELGELDFTVSNNQVTPGEKVRIYYGYLHLSHIKIKSISNRVPVKSGNIKIGYNLR